jgi:ribosome biogenesis GTPase
MGLRDLGFDAWFEAHAADMHSEDCAFARVSAVDRGSYLIRNGEGEVPAELAGKFAYRIGEPSDLPCVGDWVTVQACNGGADAIIHKVFPRRSFLRRKMAGAAIDHQMIAANIDTAFIVQSCHYDFNPSRLERYLIMARDGRVAPVVLLTKTDLMPAGELDRMLTAIGAITRSRVIALSNVTGAGLEELRRTLSPGETFCLLGSSGVGKTTLINRLMGREAFGTRAVSGTGEGTHTTSRRQLIVLPEGAMLIDTPGMRELGILGAGEAVDAGLEGFAELSAGCRYADCSHQHEPGCAVRAAVERGELHETRYQNYVKIRKESEYLGMSYVDRRRKDKAFGKFLKNAKSRLKD